MSKFIMAIDEEDNTLSNMAKSLDTAKKDAIILALNLLNYVLEQRKIGMHLTFSKEDKTKDILNEATAGSVSFKLPKKD